MYHARRHVAFRDSHSEHYAYAFGHSHRLSATVTACGGEAGVDRIRMSCSVRKVLILPQTTTSTYGTAT
eukprot:3148476-Rhodomonas_salina.1